MLDIIIINIIIINIIIRIFYKSLNFSKLLQQWKFYQNSNIFNKFIKL